MKNPTTKVTVKLTKITYYLDDNQVKTIEVAGKLNVSECKKYISDNKLGVYINKEDIKKTFEVDTIQLILLEK